MKRKYIVNGMMCAACSSSVEKVVKKLNGVQSVAVNLNSKLLVIECDENLLDDDVLKAVERAGFEAVKYEDAKKRVEKKQSIAVRLWTSIALTLLLTYLSMGKMVGIVPKFLYEGKAIVFYVCLLMVISIAVMWLNRAFFTSGVKAVFAKSPNMDTLVSVGSLSAFLYGVFSLIMIITGVVSNNDGVVDEYSKNLYFESSAMILTLVTVGKLLEEKAKNRTGSAVSKLRKLAPSDAVIFLDGNEVKISVDDLKAGDVVVVKSGDSIPADGSVIEGEGEINESSLTGESAPVFVTVGSAVKAATVCNNGYLLVKVTETGSQTLFGKIIDYVESAEATKAPIARLADKISGIFVPVVICLSLITLVIWLIISKSFETSLSYAISVLVISCPCALGLATPVAITVSMGRCASLGLLVKNAETLESVGLINVAIFDKTGTITEGKMTVVKTEGLSKDDLTAISSIEKMSSHSLGKAVTEYVDGGLEVTDFKSVTGMGVSGVVCGDEYCVGNKNFLSKNVEGEFNVDEYQSYLNDGYTALFVSKNKSFIGAVIISDALKSDSVTAISNINKLGVKTVVLSGDNQAVTNNVTRAVGASEGIGGALPENKAEIVKKYQKYGKVMFTGDGVNDSPALTVADVGVAVGGGTDVALTSADVVLMNGTTSKLYDLILIGKKTRKIIKQNLFWAFIYNVVMIPVAAGALSFIGITLTPMIAAACMSLSSIFVVTNALRLKK